MYLSPRVRTRTFLLGLCLSALAAAAPLAHAAVAVALTPATQSVPNGSDFDVFIDVTNAGSPFNAFDIVVSYDPSLMTLLPTAPTTLQQGCLMTGGCSAACGNAFHLFSAAGDSISINNVLLCNAIALTGPGRLYQLRFHAGNTQQVAQINVRRVIFYNAGLYVLPVTASSCQVGLGVQVGVGAPTPGEARRLRVEPNPSFGRVNFVSEDDASGFAEADVVDLQGRIVQHIGPVWLAARARFGWDGHDARGVRAPAGVYLVKVRRGADVQDARVILLP